MQFLSYEFDKSLADFVGSQIIASGSINYNLLLDKNQTRTGPKFVLKKFIPKNDNIEQMKIFFNGINMSMNFSCLPFAFSFKWVQNNTGIYRRTLYYQGGSLLVNYHEMKSKEEGTGKEKLTELGKQTCLTLIKAIEILHKSDFIHGDLKPTNVLFGIDKDDKKKYPVVDGVGEYYEIDEKHPFFFYLAPECRKDQSKRTKKESDIYSLGVLLYTIVVSPKMEKTNTIHFQFDEKDNLQKLIHKMISDKPEERPSIEEVLKTFEENSGSKYCNDYTKKHEEVIKELSGNEKDKNLLNCRLHETVLRENTLKIREHSVKADEILTKTFAAVSPQNSALSENSTKKIDFSAVTGLGLIYEREKDEKFSLIKAMMAFMIAAHGSNITAANKVSSYIKKYEKYYTKKEGAYLLSMKPEKLTQEYFYALEVFTLIHPYFTKDNDNYKSLEKEFERYNESYKDEETDEAKYIKAELEIISLLIKGEKSKKDDDIVSFLLNEVTLIRPTIQEFILRQRFLQLQNKAQRDKKIHSSQ